MSDITPEILPRPDLPEDQDVTPEMAAILDQRGMDQFLEATPEYVINDRNNSLLCGFVESRGWSFSLRNLQTAYRELSKQNALEVTPEYTWDNPKISPAPVDKYAGITRFQSTVVLRHPIGSPGARQLVGEKPERLEELLGDDIRKYEDELAIVQSLSKPGAPVSAPLKRVYQNSIRQSRGERNEEGLPKRWAEARAVVALNNPELRSESAAFNAEVARVLAETEK
jgi:hypothetical protein